MSGLDNIAGQIRQDAQQKADGILAQANADAQKIADAAAAELAEYKKQYARQMELDAAQIAGRFESENRQQRKQALLQVRAKVIGEVVEEAKQKLVSLPSEAYFDLMKNICVKNAQPGEGKLYFSREDSGRLPDDFVEKCNAELKNGSVKLAGSTDGFQHGFLIVYGKVEQNCSIDSIFDSQKNRIWDTVNECLAE